LDEVVGVGVVKLKISVRPNRYDRKRVKMFTDINDLQVPILTPIWDFLVERADGTGVLVHPRWRRSDGIDMLPLEQDGERTILYSAKAKASPPPPGIASDSDFSQPSDTEPSLMPPVFQRMPSPLPQPPPAPANAGEGDAHDRSSRRGYNKVLPRSPPEVPATKGDGVMSAVPVMPPLSVVPATAGSQVESWLGAQDE
jgi:hypothetical protein